VSRPRLQLFLLKQTEEQQEDKVGKMQLASRELSAPFLVLLIHVNFVGGLLLQPACVPWASAWGGRITTSLRAHTSMHPSHERSRGAIFGLSCSGGIIITASDDDLEAELNRMKMDAGKADVDTSWRSDSLHK